jgi:MoxR-like ATPase
MSTLSTYSHDDAVADKLDELAEGIEVAFDQATVPERDRARVAALIPDARIANGYVHRDALPGVFDFDLLDGAIDLRHNVLLVGPTGSSKTTLFRAYAAARQLPLAVIECSANMDPKSVLGRMTIDQATGLPVWIDGPLMLVVRYGGVVLFDEVNLAHPRVTAAFHGVTSVMRRIDLSDNGEIVPAGRGGTGEAQPVLIGAAINPTSYTGTTRLNQAFRNRFAIPVKWPYLREVEAQMVTSVTLLDFADMVRSLAEVQSPVSTNMLIEFERHCRRWGVEAASVLFCNHFDDDEVGPVERALEANSYQIAAEVEADEYAPTPEVEGVTEPVASEMVG